MEAARKVLSSHPFFKGLGAKDLATLASLAESRHYESEEFLFHEHEQSDEFYVILEGRVALETFTSGRGSIIISTLEAGEVLGWTWIVEPYVHRYNAQAVEFTRALAFNGKSLRDLCETDNHMGYELLKRFAQVMAQRLEATRLQLIDVYGVPLPRRKS